MANRIFLEEAALNATFIQQLQWQDFNWNSTMHNLSWDVAEPHVENSVIYNNWSNATAYFLCSSL